MQLSCHDMLTSMFEHEKVIMHFARIAGENLVSPDEKSTGIGPFVFVGFLEAYGIGVPVGGSGKLTDALIASIESNGGAVMANVDVGHVIVKGGRATGVATTDGREFAAKDGVIGAIHPHHLGKMVPGLDAAVVQGRRRHADFRDGLHHHPRRAERAAKIQSRRPRQGGDDRAVAQLLQRACARASIICAMAGSPIRR